MVLGRVRPPSGPLGRRLRWHQVFSKFNIEVQYVKGKDNVIADMNSRWAYPASQAFRDISKHGSEKDKEDVRKIIEQERKEEAECTLWNKGAPQQNSQGPPQAEKELVISVVGKGGGDREPPRFFTFAKPKLDRGKQLRTGTKPLRKSPLLGR